MRKLKQKAFTLIELLAVIVILAIIALIAVPVILNIIDKANKSAFKDTAYVIISAGELYWAEQQLELEGMKDEEVTFELPASTNTLGLKGNVSTGYIKITRDGEIELKVSNERYCVTKGLEEDDITITEDPGNCEIPSGSSGNQGTGGNTGKTLSQLAVDNFSVSNVDGSEPTVVTKPACLTDGTECSVGTPVAIKVNVKGDTFKFYVIEDKNNKVTLIMDRNIGDNVEWYADAPDNGHGPTTALEQLALRTNDWEIPEFTYQLSGLGEDGTPQKYLDSEVTAKVRLITYEEATDLSIGCTTSSRSCPDWMYENLYNTGDSTEDNNYYKIRILDINS